VSRESAAHERVQRSLRPAATAVRAATACIDDRPVYPSVYPSTTTFYPRWVLFLGGAFLVGLVLVAGLQLIAFGVFSRGRSSAVEVVTLVPIGLIAAACIASFCLGYWRAHGQPENLERHALAGVSLATIAGICVVAFAGVTWALWDSGTLHGTGPPTFWRVEELYLWNLADAVPLLGIPQSLRWGQPVIFDDHASGALVLAFKIAVILPLLRAVIGTLELAVEGSMSLQRKALTHVPGEAPRSEARVAQLLCGVLLIWAALAGLAFAFVLKTSSIGARQIARIPDQITLAGSHHSLLWIEAVPALFVAVFLLVVLAVLGNAPAPSTFGRDTASARERTVLVIGTLMMSFIALLVLTEAAVAASVGFFHLGFAHTTKPLDASGQIPAAASFYVWHALDAVPGLAIPDTLHWSLKHQFTDRWSNGTLIVYKLVFVAILALLIRRSVGAYFKARGTRS
jgi:hypothetical protein